MLPNARPKGLRTGAKGLRARAVQVDYFSIFPGKKCGRALG
jgi:hypothetical protein